jgi:hypothetical protein
MVLSLGRAYAPNLGQDYSYVEIQTRLEQLYLLDQEIQYEENLRNFKHAIAARESGNNWKEYNPYGYIGKFQFGKAALQVTGYGHVNFVDFMDNPSIFPEKEQEHAMDSLLRINEYLLEPYIKKYSGKFLHDSVRITRTGLLAAAHLAGPGNVKRFLETQGKHNPSDRLGTSLSDYLTTFGAHFH